MDVQTREAAVLESRPLTGRIAVVTGAGKGLGAAISEVLARDGAHVVLAGRDVGALHRHAMEIDGQYPYRQSLAVRCDVVDEAQVDRLMAETIERFERLDILVNAHGIIGPIETPAQEVTPEQFREVFEVNVLGVFLTCRAAIPYLIRRKNGRIGNIAGTSGLRGYRNRVAYSSSKWAVRGLTRTLALELGPYGITVNTVCPNVTHGQRMDTIIAEKARKQDKTSEEVYQDYTSQTALGRFIEDSDVAAAVSYLVSDGARNVTGHDIVVDAGWDV
jgi:3-oxoacyl-[acyl-carrier protein] reductase